MIHHLTQKKCIPCEAGTPPLNKNEAEQLFKELSSAWTLGEHVIGTFKLKDFNEAMAFVNKVAALAEAEGHHPNITINYNKVTLELWTHAIKGLSENDFILAAKIDQIK